MTSAESDRLSRSAVRDLVRSLGAADYLRLLLIARTYGRLVDRDGRDLLHDAIVRALDRRTCRAGTPAVAFVAGVMRSLVSDALRSAEARLNVSGLWDETEAARVAAGSAGDTEEGIHRQIDTQRLRARLDDTLKKDPELARFTQAIRDGAFGRRLADAAGIAQKDVPTLRRRLSRRVAALLDEGGKGNRP